MLLLRHGQSTWNAERRWQGLADVPLSETGRAQARAAGEALRGEGLEGAVSSDLARARETAEIIAEVLGLGPVEIVGELRERDVGQWSGLTTDDIEARWPGQLDSWRAATLKVIPGGEGDITDRVMAAVEGVVASHPGRTVLAVTHGGVLRTVERALGIEPAPIANMAGRWVESDDVGGPRSGCGGRAARPGRAGADDDGALSPVSDGMEVEVVRSAAAQEDDAGDEVGENTLKVWIPARCTPGGGGALGRGDG